MKSVCKKKINRFCRLIIISIFSIWLICQIWLICFMNSNMHQTRVKLIRRHSQYNELYSRIDHAPIRWISLKIECIHRSFVRTRKIHKCKTRPFSSSSTFLLSPEKNIIYMWVFKARTRRKFTIPKIRSNKHFVRSQVVNFAPTIARFYKHSPWRNSQICESILYFS